MFVNRREREPAGQVRELCMGGPKRNAKRVSGHIEERAPLGGVGAEQGRSVHISVVCSRRGGPAESGLPVTSEFEWVRAEKARRITKCPPSPRRARVKSQSQGTMEQQQLQALQSQMRQLTRNTQVDTGEKGFESPHWHRRDKPRIVPATEGGRHGWR